MFEVFDEITQKSWLEKTWTDREIVEAHEQAIHGAVSEGGDSYEARDELSAAPGRVADIANNASEDGAKRTGTETLKARQKRGTKRVAADVPPVRRSTRVSAHRMMAVVSDTQRVQPLPVV